MSSAKVAVADISRTGFTILIDDLKLSVPFDELPWFRAASIAAIARVEQPHPGHLFWPDLDVDLGVASIEHPERYPLRARA